MKLEDLTEGHKRLFASMDDLNEIIAKKIMKIFDAYNPDMEISITVDAQIIRIYKENTIIELLRSQDKFELKTSFNFITSEIKSDDHLTKLINRMPVIFSDLQKAVEKVIEKKNKIIKHYKDMGFNVREIVNIDVDREFLYIYFQYKRSPAEVFFIGIERDNERKGKVRFYIEDETINSSKKFFQTVDKLIDHIDKLIT
jgi:hypothetical protein